jgi:CBS domain-containing protein
VPLATRGDKAMSKNEAYMDAMLRHLGAAYYDSLHGRAAPADVARALDTIAEHFGEQPGQHPAARHATAGSHPASSRQHHHGRWRSRVRDVMTTSVVTVDRITPYKEIAGLLAEHHISGVPVLSMGRRVTGIVSEADLLVARGGRTTITGRRVPWPAGRKRHQGLTAAQLMTSPAITIHPDASIAGAARLMNAHRIRRLPVVGPEDKLMGIVSRRDLLSVFLRPDAQIARELGDILAELLPDDDAGIKVIVHNGLVTLTGPPAAAGERDLLPTAVRLAWDVEGVVDVVDRVRENGASAAQGH